MLPPRRLSHASSSQRLAKTEGPTDRLSSSLTFNLKMEAESSFQNVTALQFYNSEYGQNKKNNFTCYNTPSSETSRLILQCVQKEERVMSSFEALIQRD
jgi:hypothetical protein